MRKRRRLFQPFADDSPGLEQRTRRTVRDGSCSAIHRTGTREGVTVPCVQGHTAAAPAAAIQRAAVRAFRSKHSTAFQRTCVHQDGSPRAAARPVTGRDSRICADSAIHPHRAQRIQANRAAARTACAVLSVVAKSAAAAARAQTDGPGAGAVRRAAG